MDADLIERLAREAGMECADAIGFDLARGGNPGALYDLTLPELRRLAAAVAEQCAQECDARYMGDNNREDAEARRCAAAIRAKFATQGEQ